MTEKDKTWIEEKFAQILNSFKKPVVNIILQDANGVSIEFPEVAEGESPAIGAIANVDGQPAEGEYIMPDGATYVFVGGQLAEMIVNDENVLEDELATLRQQLAEKEAELQANVATIAEQNAQIVNIMKDVKDLKAGITSRFDGDSKKDNKKDDVITNQALSALENLKNKRKR